MRIISTAVQIARHPHIDRSLRVVTTLSVALLPSLASAAPWETSAPLADAGQISQKVELVDIDGDGFVDLVFANSGGDLTGSQADAQLNQVFINDGAGNFTEDASVFTTPDTAYVIKAGDVDRDGDPDLVVGVNFLGQSYVLLNDGRSFNEQMLGDAVNRSIGDLELGDVDGDGDLDVFAADWGTSQPYGDPDDTGGPMRLWLGDGDGGFTAADANLPMGMEALASWAFDVELADIDNDYDLDALISSRGFGKALVFRNDGGGNFENYAVPALQPGVGKNVNVGFTPIDIDGDDYVDVLTLQDGPGSGGCVDIDGNQICAKRNSLLLNDTVGQFLDNPGDYWDIAVNSPKLDFDLATLDFNNDGSPDFVVTGLRLAGVDNNNRLFINDPVGKKYNLAAAPNDTALPLDASLGKTFGIAFADFNGDKREDVAVAVRDVLAPSAVLFGGVDPDNGVPVDVSAPNISNHEMLADPLYFGQAVTFRGRAHDSKTPTQWHDFQYEPNLEDLNLIGDVPTAHKRRLPYIEFMFGLNDPNDIKTTPDTDPDKYISPGVWEGEALWQVHFEGPLSGTTPDTLTWQFCAIDAAGNKACDGPYQVIVNITCGNGEVDLGEDCDDPNDLLCVDCINTCGDGMCLDPETPRNCPEDCPCDFDDVCEQPEDDISCPDDCPTNINTDSNTEGGSATVTAPTDTNQSDSNTDSNGELTHSFEVDSVTETNSNTVSDSESNSNSETLGHVEIDGGCICGATSGHAGGLFSLLLALGLRRRRRS